MRKKKITKKHIAVTKKNSNVQDEKQAAYMTLTPVKIYQITFYGIPDRSSLRVYSACNLRVLYAKHIVT